MDVAVCRYDNMDERLFPACDGKQFAACPCGKGGSNDEWKIAGQRIKGEDKILSFEEASKRPCFGTVLKDGMIDISFDDAEMSEKFLEMAKANAWRCLVLKNPTNGHLHTFWKNEQGEITKLSAEDQKLAVGFIADIHGGSTYIPLRVHGVDRFPPIYDISAAADAKACL